MRLHAAVNGGRHPAEHRAIPVHPAEIAAEAVGAVCFGADTVQMQPRDPGGGITLEAAAVAAALRAVRARCQGIPLGLTARRCGRTALAGRLAWIAEWHELPDFVAVSFQDAHAEPLAAAVRRRNIALEAILCSEDAVERLVASGLGSECVRLLVQPPAFDRDEALRCAGAIERRLDAAGLGAPRLLHGWGPTAWLLLEVAARRHAELRIGLEDVLTCSDGRWASGNAELVAEAWRVAQFARRFWRHA